MAEAILQTHAPQNIGKSEWRPFRADGQVSSAKELLIPAGLGWEPEFRPLFVPDEHEGTRKVEGWRAVCRNDSGNVLGVVGDRYHLIHNATMAEMADAIKAASEGSLSYGNAGSYRGGARPFLQLSRGERKVGKYEIESIISTFTAHDGTLNYTAGFSSTVIVCKNTYAQALKDAKSAIQIRHTQSSEKRLKEIQAILVASAKYVESFDNQALHLMGKKFTDENMAALAQMLIPGDATKSKNSREKLFEAYVSAPGANPGTAWGATQAVSYIANHERNTRAIDRTAEEARSEAVWMGSGREMIERAWWTVMDDNAVQKMTAEFMAMAA